MYYFVKGIFVNDFLRDDVDWEFRVLCFQEVISEIEFFDVSDETFFSWIGDETVEEIFGGGDCGSGSTQNPAKSRRFPPTVSCVR